MNLINISAELTADATTARDTDEFATLEAFLADSSATHTLLEVDQEIESLLPELGRLQSIALDFPVFSDGRHYSSARILRQKGFTGAIRAIGDVRLDQLEQMARCGFSEFELAEGQSTDQAKDRLEGFTYSYQLTADRAPLFKTR